MKLDKLVVGVVGLGMGALHLKGAIDYGAEIGMICDVDKARLSKVGNENNIPKERQTTDFYDVVNNKNINAVIIATPDAQHRCQVEECLKAGKHVLCEKPLALTREDISAMVAAEREHHEFQQ